MFVKKDVQLAQEYLAFVLLNVFDLFLTGWIFRHDGVELNGAAAWVIEKYGLMGFVWYKFIMVAIVVLVCERISTMKLSVSRSIITIGCLIYVFVIFWECFQVAVHITGPDADSSAAVVRALRIPAPTRVGTIRAVNIS